MRRENKQKAKAKAPAHIEKHRLESGTRGVTDSPGPPRLSQSSGQGDLI